jgi:DNA-binding NarL/FixJ family response regulator
MRCMKTRILLVDDHRIMRDGLRALIADEPHMEVVAEAQSGRDAIEMACKHTPDVITMDIGLPDMNGIAATRAILREIPQVKILALSTHSDRQYVVEIIRAGARGYLVKDCASHELLHAVRVVLQGHCYLSQAVADLVMTDILRDEASLTREPALSLLSPRELQVLRMLANGLTTKHIKAEMSISGKTAETYLYRLRKKLGIYNVADLTKFAIRHGLVSLTWQEPPAV